MAAKTMPPTPSSPPPPPADPAPSGGAPGTGPSAGTPLVDWPAFEDEYDRIASVVEKLVATVLRTRSGDPARLREAARAGDAGTIRFLAHGLKTVGGLIKCQRLRDAARAAELAAADGAGDPPSLALDLADTLDLMLAELRARTGTAAP